MDVVVNTRYRTLAEIAVFRNVLPPVLPTRVAARRERIQLALRHQAERPVPTRAVPTATQALARTRASMGLRTRKL